MRRRLPGIDVALSLAVDRVRELYERIPESNRPDVTGERWSCLDDQVDRACSVGDKSAALMAIEQWESHISGVLARIALSLPFEVKR